MGLFRRADRADVQRADPSHVKCSTCNQAMTLLLNSFVSREVMAQSQGCFQCGACGVYTCYDCSDNRTPCRCGEKKWRQASYV